MLQAQRRRRRRRRGGELALERELLRLQPHCAQLTHCRRHRVRARRCRVAAREAGAPLRRRAAQRRLRQRAVPLVLLLVLEFDEIAELLGRNERLLVAERARSRVGDHLSHVLCGERLRLLRVRLRSGRRARLLAVVVARLLVLEIGEQRFVQLRLREQALVLQKLLPLQEELHLQQLLLMLLVLVLLLLLLLVLLMLVLLRVAGEYLLERVVGRLTEVLLLLRERRDRQKLLNGGGDRLGLHLLH